MNLQKQLIAFAEFCGWRAGWPKSGNGLDHWTAEKLFRVKAGVVAKECYWLPDYLNDLNVLHAAWLLLSDEQKRDFWSTLRTIMHGEKPLVEVLYNYLTPGATPAQFREALLRTIGKWEDGE